MAAIATIGRVACGNSRVSAMHLSPCISAIRTGNVRTSLFDRGPIKEKSALPLFDEREEETHGISCSCADTT